MISSFIQAPLLLEMPSGSEWLIIVVAVIVLFGGKKVPEFMRGLGKGIREFNDAKNNVKREIEEGMKEQPVPAETPAPAPIPASVQEIGSPEKHA